MFSRHIKTTFPIYEKEELKHNKRPGSETDYSPYYLSFFNQLLPAFQFEESTSLSVTKIEAVNLKTGVKYLQTGLNVSTLDIVNGGVTKRRFIHMGAQSLPTNIPEGAYYLLITMSNGSKFYSEDFKMCTV